MNGMSRAFWVRPTKALNLLPYRRSHLLHGTAPNQFNIHGAERSSFIVRQERSKDERIVRR